MPDPDLLTTREAATMLRASRGTLRAWRSQGRGPPYIAPTCPGGCAYYRRADIVAYIQKKETQSDE